MPKDKDSYEEINLSRLYELEDKRHKMGAIAEERIKKGESLATPELLRESEDFHRMMVDEKMLERLEKQVVEREKRAADEKKKHSSDEKGKLKPINGGKAAPVKKGDTDETDG